MGVENNTDVQTVEINDNDLIITTIDFYKIKQIELQGKKGEFHGIKRIDISYEDPTQFSFLYTDNQIKDPIQRLELNNLMLLYKKRHGNITRAIDNNGVLIINTRGKDNKVNNNVEVIVESINSKATNLIPENTK